MNFDSFMKDPLSSKINLSTYDSKNAYGEVFYSQKAVDELQKTIQRFEIEQINLKGNEAMNEAQNLIVFNKILDIVANAQKDLLKSIIDDKNVEQIDLSNVAKLPTNTEKPSQIYEIAGLNKLFTTINDKVRDKLNLSTNFLDTNVKSTLVNMKDRTNFERSLKWDLATADDMVKTSLSNITKLGNNPDLQAYIKNTPKFLETPINFSAKIKNDDNLIVGIIPPDLNKIFTTKSEKIEELNHNLTLLLQSLKERNNIFTYKQILDLKNATERLGKILQLDPLSAELVNNGSLISVATSQKTALLHNNSAFFLQKTNAREILMPILDDRQSEKVELAVYEKFADAPRNISYITRLDKPLSLDDIVGLSNAENLENKIINQEKIKQSTSLDENINTLKLL